MTTKTKNGQSRKGKATITQARLDIRDMTWARVKLLLQHHLKISPHGEQSAMAHAIGLEPSQIHRYSCPVCEHDQEPTFSVGIAIMAYIACRYAPSAQPIDI